MGSGFPIFLVGLKVSLEKLGAFKSYAVTVWLLL